MFPLYEQAMFFHIDLAEGLPSNQGYKHILLVVDPFSKLLLTYPLKEKTAAHVLPYMMHTVFQMFHVRMVISDGGPCFKASDFRKAMSQLCITHKIVSPHHPQANSHAESKVKRLKDMLRKMLSSERSTDWLIRLPLATKILNCSKLGEIPLSPMEILWGKDQPNSQHLLTTPSQHLDIPPYKNATETQLAMKPIINKYKKLVNERNVKRKSKINANLKDPEVRVGAYVILKDFAILKGINRTLDNVYKNEFYVIETVKSKSVIAKSLTTFQSKLIAFSNIKVINEKNFAKLDIPPVLSKILLKDARILTQDEQLYIAQNSQAIIPPEPGPEVLAEYLSDSEEEFTEDEPDIRKSVKFNLADNEIKEF